MKNQKPETHNPKPRTLGVTGGIGSGKTTVCRLLERHGARVFYADAEAKRIMTEDADAVRAITEAFGAESYFPDGTLNRAHLAATVFADEARVAQINAIVHPRVHRAFEHAKTQAAADGVALLVKEAALIFEAGGENQLDAVAVVHAPEADRIDRVTLRDAVEPAAVLARMRHQLPPDELRARADYVITNDGTLADLEAEVATLYHWATSDAPRRSTTD